MLILNTFRLGLSCLANEVVFKTATTECKRIFLSSEE